MPKRRCIRPGLDSLDCNSLARNVKNDHSSDTTVSSSSNQEITPELIEKQPVVVLERVDSEGLTDIQRKFDEISLSTIATKTTIAEDGADNLEDSINWNFDQDANVQENEPDQINLIDLDGISVVGSVEPAPLNALDEIFGSLPENIQAIDVLTPIKIHHPLDQIFGSLPEHIQAIDVLIPIKINRKDDEVFASASININPMNETVFPVFEFVDCGQPEIETMKSPAETLSKDEPNAAIAATHVEIDVSNTVNTSAQLYEYKCITASKQYEHKSLEEHRLDYYLGSPNDPNEAIAFSTQLYEFKCITASKKHENKSLEEHRLIYYLGSNNL